MKAIKSLTISVWIIMAFTITSAYAQMVPGASDYHEQALLFSRYEYTGTARIQGIGGVQMSLGGDLSSAMSNPAGLGFYNRSEASFTPSIGVLNSDANYVGSNVSSTKTTFNFDNLGVVFNKTKSRDNLNFLQSRSFAISYSKINDFNNNIEYAGDNTKNNIVDYAIQDAYDQGYPTVDNLTGFAYDAYQAYLISEYFDAFQNGNDTTYSYFYDRTFFSEFPTENFPTHQTERIESRGSQNQVSFAYGGNIEDRFYFGLNVGVLSVDYQTTKYYDEIYPEGDIGHSLFLTETLDVEGLGINATLGVIARPINSLLIGASFVTPSAYNLNEYYTNNMTVNYNSFNFGDYNDYFTANEGYFTNNRGDDYLYTGTDYDAGTTISEQSLDQLNSELTYNLTTPWRINGGLTYFIGKSGFISGDVEYVDYSSMKVRAQKDDEISLESQNDIIKASYGSALNWNVGSEIRLNEFRIRAGFAYYASPYANGRQSDNNRYNISLGGGMRTKKFFVDLAVVNKYYESDYAPYTLDGSADFLQTPYASITNSNLNVVVSGGFFF